MLDLLVIQNSTVASFVRDKRLFLKVGISKYH